MQVVVDKEKPVIGCTRIRGLNLTAVRLTTVQLTGVSESLHKLRDNLLHKPALTGNLCIYYINIIYYSKVTICNGVLNE
jgi:hypothetical protein